MIELMKQLCALPGPSGCEDAVREFVLEKVKPFADEIKMDAIGNIMVFRKGKKALERPVVLCAHMDGQRAGPCKRPRTGEAYAPLRRAHG